MPLFTVTDALNLWKNTKDHSHWSPDFLHCGSFDYKLDAFSVKTKGVHYLWIPVEWKAALRFLNHVIYSMWYASLDRRLPDNHRGLSSRMGKYAEHLRSGFFNEVLEYWYRPGTQLPTSEQPTRQNYPLHSCYLTSFLLGMFNNNIPVLTPDTSMVASEGWKSVPTTFDWETWAQQRATNRALYGVLPDVGTEEHRLLLEENRVARIPNTPSVEIDSSSWSGYASELVESIKRRRRHSTISTVPTRRSYPVEIGVNKSLMVAKRRRMT